MPTVDLIRHANLLLLVERAGTQRALAESIDKSPAQVSQWIGRKPDAQGNPRNISGKSARDIEQRLSLPPGWMDQDHRDVPGEAVPAIRDAPTIEGLMNELGPRLKKAPPHIRELVGQSLLKYSTNPEDGESIARAIRSLLEPYA
jgi:hypothetical protein